MLLRNPIRCIPSASRSISVGNVTLGAATPVVEVAGVAPMPLFGSVIAAGVVGRPVDPAAAAPSPQLCGTDSPLSEAAWPTLAAAPAPPASPRPAPGPKTRRAAKIPKLPGRRTRSTHRPRGSPGRRRSRPIRRRHRPWRPGRPRPRRTRSCPRSGPGHRRWLRQPDRPASRRRRGLAGDFDSAVARRSGHAGDQAGRSRDGRRRGLRSGAQYHLVQPRRR